jgi:hypothetical protein
MEQHKGVQECSAKQTFVYDLLQCLHLLALTVYSIAARPSPRLWRFLLLLRLGVKFGPLHCAMEERRAFVFFTLYVYLPPPVLGAPDFLPFWSAESLLK